MLSWLARRARRKRNAHDLYGSIVALSRSHVLYAEMGIPDTLEARFEMLVFHLFLCLERIAQSASENTFLSQDIVDMFFADMDTTARELGVGDMVVPKKMKSLAAVYGERMHAYNQAIMKKRGNLLSDALTANIISVADASRPISGLSEYVRDLRKSLSNTGLADLEAGRIHGAVASTPDNRRAR